MQSIPKLLLFLYLRAYSLLLHFTSRINRHAHAHAHIHISRCTYTRIRVQRCLSEVGFSSFSFFFLIFHFKYLFELKQCDAEKKDTHIHTLTLPLTHGEAFTHPTPIYLQLFVLVYDGFPAACFQAITLFARLLFLLSFSAFICLIFVRKYLHCKQHTHH